MIEYLYQWIEYRYQIGYKLLISLDNYESNYSDIVSLDTQSERGAAETSERGTSTDGIRQDDRRQTVNAVRQVTQW